MRSLPVIFGLLVIAAPAPAAGWELLGGRAFYFGELHAHSGLSGDGASSDLGNCEVGGCGNLADYYANARGLAGLDFASLTDHLNGQFAIAAEDWPEIVALTEAGHDPDAGFVTLLGGEMQLTLSDGTDLGHRNYLFFGEPGDAADVTLDDLLRINLLDSCEEMWEAVREMETRVGPLLFVPHHPAASLPMATRWWCQDERLAPLVEVYSSHGNSRDTPDRDDFDPLHFAYVDGCTVNEALASAVHGLHLGLIGGTDFHDTWPGMVCHTDVTHGDQAYGGSLTGVFLDGDRPLDRASLYDAMLHRRTFATSGPRVPVLFSLVDGSGNEVAVAGDVLAPPPTEAVYARVTFPVDLAPYVLDVELYDSAQVPTSLPEQAPGVHELPLSWWQAPWFGYAIVHLDGGSWYADQGIVCEDGGDNTEERIWTSPIWIEQLDDQDDDGDGYSEVDGDCDDMLASVYPGATELDNHLDDDCDGEIDEGFDPADDDDETADDDTTEAPQDDDDSSSGAIDPPAKDCSCRVTGRRAAPVLGLVLLGIVAGLRREWRRT